MGLNEKTPREIAEDFGERIADNLGDFDPDDSELEMVVAEAEASLLLLKASLLHSQSFETVSKHAVDVASAMAVIAFMEGDLSA